MIRRRFFFMTPEDELAAQQDEFDELVDDLINKAPSQWSDVSIDGIRKFSHIQSVVDNYRTALQAYAAASPSIEVQEDYLHKAEQLSANFTFMVEVLGRYWKRKASPEIPAECPADAVDLSTSANLLGGEYVNLRSLKIKPDIVRLIPEPIARQFTLLPIKLTPSRPNPIGEISEVNSRGDLYVAFGGANIGYDILKNLHQTTGYNIIIVFADAEAILEELARLYNS